MKKPRKIMTTAEYEIKRDGTELLLYIGALILIGLTFGLIIPVFFIIHWFVTSK